MEASSTKPTPKTRPAEALVVEDDPLIRVCLSRVLRSAGFAVVTASDGRDALAALEGGAHPALVFTDLDMPVLAGAQFVEALRRRPEFADVPVIVVSGSLDRCPGATLHLPKPFDVDDVLRAVALLAPRTVAPPVG